MPAVAARPGAMLGPFRTPGLIPVDGARCRGLISAAGDIGSTVAEEGVEIGVILRGEGVIIVDVVSDLGGRGVVGVGVVEESADESIF